MNKILKRILVSFYMIESLVLIGCAIGYVFALAAGDWEWWTILIILPLLIINMATFSDVTKWAEK